MDEDMINQILITHLSSPDCHRNAAQSEIHFYRTKKNIQIGIDLSSYHSMLHAIKRDTEVLCHALIQRVSDHVCPGILSDTGKFIKTWKSFFYILEGSFMLSEI